MQNCGWFVSIDPWIKDEHLTTSLQKFLSNRRTVTAEIIYPTSLPAMKKQRMRIPYVSDEAKSVLKIHKGPVREVLNRVHRKSGPHSIVNLYGFWFSCTF